MRTNVFGHLCQVAFVCWSAFCAYGCVDATAEASNATANDTALGFAALVIWATWGGMWLVPSIGMLIGYRMLGVSHDPKEPPKET